MRVVLTHGGDIGAAVYGRMRLAPYWRSGGGAQARVPQEGEGLGRPSHPRPREGTRGGASRSRHSERMPVSDTARS